MGIRQGFKMALKSIFANKVRSILTMLGIIIGVAAVMTLVSVVQGQNQQIRKYYESMGTNKIDVYAYSWTGKDITQGLYDYCLGLDEYVLGVTPNSSYWGDIKYKATSTSSNQELGTASIYLGSDQYSLCNNYEIERGRDISFLDVRSYNQVIVIGAELKDYLFQYRDPIGQRVTIDGNSFTVIGVYKRKDMGDEWSTAYHNYLAVTPYTMARIFGNSYSSDFTVKAKSSAATTEAITRLQNYLSGEIGENDGYYHVYSQNEWMEQSDEQNKIMSLVLGGIAGISLLVGGIGIMNIMLVTVRERTREIGIRKAIGGARKSILAQFLIESAVICGVGGVFGIIVGFLGTLVAGKLILKFTLFPSTYMSLFAFLFSVVLGIGFGMYPAIKASGLQPVEALRAE